MSAEAKLRLLPAVPKTGTVECSQPSDGDLIRALVDGDPDAGEQLYDRLVRVVDWTLMRVIGERCEEHDDLVQSAFEQVVRTILRGSFSKDCSLTSWASAIASNLALNALRSRRRDRRFLVAVETPPSAKAPTDVEAQVIARRRLQLARAELMSMNPQRAQAVILHDVNGLALDEMAAALGVSIAAAQSRLSRGRREISARIARFEGDLQAEESDR